MLQLILLGAAGLVGYLWARTFVSKRLRFVDSVHSFWAPLAAGLLAFLVAWPTALLPFVSLTPAAIFGLATGLGTVAGARSIRRSERRATRRLTS